jgi:hypothetical protein
MPDDHSKTSDPAVGSTRLVGRSGLEIAESCRREGWVDAFPSWVLKTKDWVKVIWADGTIAEGRISPNAKVRGGAKNP